uniref:Uncharacterized protein n=1 Tax=Oryza meridionalis TaxID=40149 RepID=A0A0E0DGH9_9ORYZ
MFATLAYPLASLSPRAAREATTWPPLSPTSLLCLAVARAAAGKAARPQGRQRQGFPRLLALGRSGEPPGVATVVTARPAPFRPDLSGWLAAGTATTTGTDDSGGRGRGSGGGAAAGGGQRTQVSRGCHWRSPALLLASADIGGEEDGQIWLLLPRSGASSGGDGVDWSPVVCAGGVNIAGTLGVQVTFGGSRRGCYG